ncbi:Multi-component transcriptional regulator, winged helix family [Moritella viscosa]|uniref:response regulator transcription factor n=1 Tax=Moritella viscosa TaxID=80854 RepID=UPI0005091C4E|nr:response regulator transcription factor [Moritella viscosa]CED58932.1 response regulator [Moritella viscosa]SHN98606.1 Multi-component transcriptional regulator, winged helix family [Moritella viscosa]SHO19916.1 Multi-component transcriptional regulator, winged helix family [Moritella viscosa]
MLDIVIIEDDLQLREMLCYFLSEIEGCDIDCLDTGDGDGAVEFIIEKQPKLVLLDIQLPHTSGLSVLKTLKEQKFEAPILMMTANDTELTETNSLLLGANDYVTKPIRTKVLSERIKRQLDLYLLEKQVDEQQEDNLSCNQFYLSAQHSSVFYNQIQIKLIPSEYELLEILSDAEQPISVAVLFEKIHGFSYHEEDRSIYMRISSLRKKFAIQLPGVELIKNRRAKGFFLSYPMIKR